MATVHLPRNLLALFPAAPRQAQIDASTVLGLIDGLNERWPGMRSRLLDAGPTLRQHILIFVDDERADLSTSIGGESQVRVIPSITGG